MKKFALLTALLLLLLYPMSGQQGQTCFFTITGNNQGAFPGESNVQGHLNDLEGYAFHYEITQPVDKLGGVAKGNRQHGTITITKKIGKASPAIFKAMVNAEKLTITIYFYRLNQNGQLENYYKITLKDGYMTKVNQFKNIIPTQNAGVSSTVEFEELSFTFDNIEVKYMPDNHAENDKWKPQKQ